jgi:hypothetical protein
MHDQLNTVLNRAMDASNALLQPNMGASGLDPAQPAGPPTGVVVTPLLRQLCCAMQVRARARAMGLPFWSRQRRRPALTAWPRRLPLQIIKALAGVTGPSYVQQNFVHQVVKVLHRWGGQGLGGLGGQGLVRQGLAAGIGPSPSKARAGQAAGSGGGAGAGCWRRCGDAVQQSLNAACWV